MTKKINRIKIDQNLWKYWKTPKKIIRKTIILIEESDIYAIIYEFENTLINLQYYAIINEFENTLILK